jgi:phosphonate transport system substrate-binding protein
LRFEEETMTRRFVLVGLALGIVMMLTGGASTADAQPKFLHLVLTPSQKPTDLLVAGEKFGVALGKLVGIPVRVTVASDYAAVVEALRNKTADLAFLHPAGYVLANREAKAMIIAQDQWHGNTSYRSRIFVRKDSGIKTLEELRGKTIAFVDPTSTSGYVWPMVLLIKRGLVQNRDPKTFFREAVFSGAHDAALQSLLNGHVDAIASFDQMREQYLKDPAEREKVTWVAETDPIPEGGIAGREGLDPPVVAKVKAALLQMRGPEYAQLLKDLYDIDGFEPVDDRVYEPVRAAMDELGWRPKR